MRDIEPEEQVLLIVRRHPLVLFGSTLRPLALLLLLGGLARVVGAWGGGSSASVLGVLVLSVFAWLLYAWADWRADLLVLTDSRVLWIERTPLLRERRWEAPLSSIQNVAAISRGPVHSLTACADLVLDTASRGVQRLHGLRRAQEAAVAILQAQAYDARRSTRLRRLRSGQGMPPEQEPAEVLRPPRPRVWRRHPWMLVQPSVPPVGLLIAAGLVSNLPGAAPVGVVLGSIAILWELWLVDDWRNDEIVATADRIIQTRRSPLRLREESWRAPLDKIEDIGYEIGSPLAQVLNYGTITVATAGDGADFSLTGMPKPREISAELNHRLRLRKQAGQQALLREVEATVHGVLRSYGLSHSPVRPHTPAGSSGNDPPGTNSPARTD